MTDKFFDSNDNDNNDDDVVTTSHNDKVSLRQLEIEVNMLKNEIKEKDRIIQNYEETISKYSIQDIKDAVNDLGFTNEEIQNIMNNQAFIIVKDVKK